MKDTPAERIKKYLKDKGIKQSFVSRKTGINNKTLAGKLNGQIRLNVDDIELICAALEKQPSDFLKPRLPESDAI